MAINKMNMLVGLAAGVVIGGATLGTIGVSAASSQSTLVDRIAEKFNLNAVDVQTEFDAFREEKHASMEAAQNERLQNLVDDGTITAEQKTALLEKRAEMEKNREVLKDSELTREEMHTKMDAARTEFEAWLTDQGIDPSLIMNERGRGHHGMGPGGHRGFDGPVDDASDAGESESAS